MMPSSCRHGLTLLELVVVLAILVTLTTVATISAMPRIDATRYEATKRTLEDIRAAAEGQWLGGVQTGYAGDLGQLPDTLTQLIQPPANGALLWANRLANDTVGGLTDNINLAGGWRGPYLQLGVGQTTVLDGWGDPFSLSRTAATGALSVLTAVHEAPYGAMGFTDTIIPSTALRQPIGMTVNFVYAGTARPTAIAIYGPDPLAATLRLEAILDPRPDMNALYDLMFPSSSDRGIGPGLRVLVMTIDPDGSGPLVPALPFFQVQKVLPLTDSTVTITVP